MLPLVYTNPFALELFDAVCLLWLVPEIIFMPFQMAKVARGKGLVQDRGSLVVLLVLQWFGLAANFSLAFFLPALAIAWQRPGLFFLGAILVVLGVTLRWYAIHTLGEYFTRDVVVSHDQLVVQSGAYRFIRHPAYSGTFLTMLGIGLMMSNWGSLIVLLACVFSGHFYRVKIEEKALIHIIGQPYLEYMQRTGRFIPRLF